MPSCLVRYRVVIPPRGRRGGNPAHTVAGTALVDEEWEPDEWGDPGRCVRRRALVMRRGEDGGCYLDRVRGRSGHWRITGAKIAGAIRWAGTTDVEFDLA